MKARFTLAALGLFAASMASADVKVGVIVTTTTGGSALGIPMRSTIDILPKTLGGENVSYIVLDDAGDPTVATKNARKLEQDDKVDLIIGSGIMPAAIAIAQVAAEAKVPQIALTPIPNTNAGSPYSFSVPQPAGIMMKTVADHAHKQGIKKVAYIGYNDAWGDLAYNGFLAPAKEMGMDVVTNERYARSDTSVMGQVVKIIAVKPDAVVVGGSGTSSALPHITLREKGYAGPIYHNHGIIGKDFLRVGGAKVEGAYAPTGPVIVAGQLPDSNPIKKVALEFIQAYDAKFGAGSHNAFSAYTYDAYLLADNAVAQAKQKAKPGTPEFRSALRDALEQTKEVVGTHGVYSMSPGNHNGLDQRASVLVQVEKGDWKLIQ
jgi:branched-chain amino acid transport system substrate-binding protein